MLRDLSIAYLAQKSNSELTTDAPPWGVPGVTQSERAADEAALEDVLG